MKYKYSNMNEYNIHEIEVNKFKTIQLDFKFIEPVNKNTITYRSLLPYVLKAGCKKYPSKSLIKTKLDELYGSNLFVNASRQGNLSIITFSISFVNEKYIKESLNKEIIDFIKEILFNPLVKNSSFDEEIFDEEVRLLKDEFNTLIDNKSKYAYNRLINIMFDDENYKYSSLGLEEDLDKITAKSLYEYYLEFLNNELEIIINGEKNNIKELILGLPFKTKPLFNSPIDYEAKDIKEVKKVLEYQKNKQAKLVMGYRTEIRVNDELRYPMVLASCIFGGYPHSKLFRIVREENSLAYSIYSKYDAYKGVLFVQAGINNDTLDKTIDLINYCLSELQTNITNDEFEMTKVSLINDYLEMLDSQAAISNKAFNTALVNNKFIVEETIDSIKNVKIEDVYKAANEIKLDTIYFLGCEKDEENN